MNKPFVCFVVNITTKNKKQNNQSAPHAPYLRPILTIKIKPRMDTNAH